MHMQVNRPCKRTVRATLALALTVPFIAFAAEGDTMNHVYVGGGGGKSQNQETDGNRKTSGKAFLGYEFNKAVSLEAGYVDLGKHDSRGSTTVRERGPFIEAIVHFTASESFSPFLKGGVHRLDVETHPSGTGSKARNTEPAWGAGFNFNIGKHMGLRFEWERFNIRNHDTDLVSANIVHYFR
jgi:opacity protein-like surface antigen